MGAPAERRLGEHRPVERPGGKRVARAILTVLTVGLVASAAVLGWHRANPPRHCPAGLRSLADRDSGYRRCCGQGQRLDGDRCVGAPLGCADGMDVTPAGCIAQRRQVPIAAGRLVITATDWEATSRIEPRDTEVAAFAIDSHEVVERGWQQCVAEGRCPPIPLTGEPGRPVTGVTAAEAQGYCHLRGGELPTSDQLAFAACGAAGRRYPWGATGAVCRRAVFGLIDGPCGWGARGPDLAGSRPSGATPEGVLDLAGNVAEWARRTGDGGETTGWEVRGGSWRDAAAADLRTWAAVERDPETRSSTIGFRCVYHAAPSPNR